MTGGLGRPGLGRLGHHHGWGPFPAQVSCRRTQLHGDPCSRGARGSGHARRSVLAFADRLAEPGRQASLPPIRPGGAPQGVAWCVPTSAGQGREVSLIGRDVVSGGAGLPGLQGVACPSHGPGGRVAGSLGQGPGRARRGGQQGAQCSELALASEGLFCPLVLPELLPWGPGDAWVRGAWPTQGPAGDGPRAPAGPCLQWHWGLQGCPRAPTCPLPGFSRGDPCPQVRKQSQGLIRLI